MIRQLVQAYGRRRWPQVQATVVDQRHIKEHLIRFDASSKLSSLDEYMFEYLSSSGEQALVAVTVESINLPLFRKLQIGQTVPLHVHPGGTKAVLGEFESEVQRKRGQRAAKEQQRADKARFDERLRRRPD